MTNNDEEQYLPANQRWLFTSSVEHFFMLADLLRQKESDALTMGIVSGAPGVGKSMAALMYQSQMEQEQQISPPCKIVRIPPSVTTRGLMDAIAPARGREDKKNSSRTTYELFDQVVSMINQDHIRLLIFDEGEHLKHEHLKLLRMLADQTHCALLLIGLQSMLKSLPPSIVDHVGLRWTFSPLETEEVLHVVLPQLVFTGWVFDPHNDSDLAFGKELWEAVRPSLRRLYMVLSCASLLVQHQGEQLITAKMIHQAFRLMDRPFQSPDEDHENTNEED